MYLKRVIIKDKERIKLWRVDILSAKASKFKSDIKIKEIEKEADCKSYEDILKLISNKGCILEIAADGVDEERAVNEIVNLVENHFEEERQQYQYFLD